MTRKGMNFVGTVNTHLYPDLTQSSQYVYKRTIAEQKTILYPSFQMSISELIALQRLGRVQHFMYICTSANFMDFMF